MDISLLDALTKAGVNKESISMLEDDEFDTVDILRNTSDQLLKACGLKGGQVVRIRNALVTMTHEISTNTDALGHTNENVPPSAQKPPSTPKTPSGSAPRTPLVTTPSASTANTPLASTPAKTPLASTPKTHLAFTPRTPSVISIDNEEEFDLTTSVFKVLNHPAPSPVLPKNLGTSSPLNSSAGFAIKETKIIRKLWLKDFKLPDTYSPKVNEALNARKLFGKLRSEFTRDICNSIKMHTLFPTREEKQRVASMIIEKYPFLIDSLGAGTGSWFLAISNRFKNMRRNKVIEHKTCAEKKKPEKVQIKTKKRKLDVPPAMVDGETPETCEEHKKAMVVEMTKTKKNFGLLKELMELTYPYRRQQFLLQPKKLEDILVEYPALQLVSEAKAEFGRILSDQKALINMADNYSGIESKVLEWAASISNKSVKQLVSAMKTRLLEDPNRKEDIESTVVALILQTYLKEKSCGSRNLFFMICTDDDSIDEEVTRTTYPRIIASGEIGSLSPIYIAAEGQVFLDLSGKKILARMAVAMVMATFYILNMEYTPEVSNVYAFLEAVMMEKHADAKKRISIQKLVKELGLNLG